MSRSCSLDRVPLIAGTSRSSVRTSMERPFNSTSSFQRGLAACTASRIDALTATSSNRSSSTPCTDRWRRCAKSRARCPAVTILSTNSSNPGSSVAMRSICAGTSTPVRMLLRLWLTPADSSPTARKRSVRKSSRSIRLRSVTSSNTATIWPEGSLQTAFSTHSESRLSAYAVSGWRSGFPVFQTLLNTSSSPISTTPG